MLQPFRTASSLASRTLLGRDGQDSEGALAFSCPIRPLQARVVFLIVPSIISVLTLLVYMKASSSSGSLYGAQASCCKPKRPTIAWQRPESLQKKNINLKSPDCSVYSQEWPEYGWRT